MLRKTRPITRFTVGPPVLRARVVIPQLLDKKVQDKARRRGVRDQAVLPGFLFPLFFNPENHSLPLLAQAAEVQNVDGERQGAAKVVKSGHSGAKVMKRRKTALSDAFQHFWRLTRRFPWVLDHFCTFILECSVQKPLSDRPESALPSLSDSSRNRPIYRQE